MPGQGKFSARKIQSKERQDIAWRAKAQGKTLTEIGDEIGVSAAQVHRLLQKQTQTIDLSIESSRALAIERAEALFREAMEGVSAFRPAALAGSVKGGQVHGGYISQALKCAQELAKLSGHYPTADSAGSSVQVLVELVQVLNPDDFAAFYGQVLSLANESQLEATLVGLGVDTGELCDQHRQRRLEHTQHDEVI